MTNLLMNLSKKKKKKPEVAQYKAALVIPCAIKGTSVIDFTKSLA